MPGHVTASASGGTKDSRFVPLGHKGRQAAGAGVRADAALGTRGPVSSVKTRRSRPGRWGSAGAARHCPRHPAKRTVLGPETSPTGGVAHALGRSAWGLTHRLERGFHGQRGAALPVLSPVTPSPRPAQQRGCSACLQPAAPGPALSRFPCGHTGRCPRPAPVTAQAAVPRGWGHDAVCDMDVQPGAGAWAPHPQSTRCSTDPRAVDQEVGLGGALVAGPLSWGGAPQSPLPRGTWERAEVSPRHPVGWRLVPRESHTTLVTAGSQPPGAPRAVEGGLNRLK